MENQEMFFYALMGGSIAWLLLGWFADSLYAQKNDRYEWMPEYGAGNCEEWEHFKQVLTLLLGPFLFIRPWWYCRTQKNKSSIMHKKPRGGS